MSESGRFGRSRAGSKSDRTSGLSKCLTSRHPKGLGVCQGLLLDDPWDRTPRRLSASRTLIDVGGLIGLS